MKDHVGLCTACNALATFKPKTLYYICPHCDDSISCTEARTYLDALCANPAKVNEVIKMCIDLDAKHGPGVPIHVLDVLQKHHPFNEDIAFTMVRLAGYTVPVVRAYLHGFAEVPRTTPYATEFLDNVLKHEYMPYAGEIGQYIENKLSDANKKKYKARLSTVKSDYVAPKPITSAGMAFIYGYYAVGAVINVALAACFIFVIDWAIYFTIMLAIAVFLVELGALYIHHRMHGNRIGINKTERLLLAIFTSTIMVTIAGVIIGAVV